MSAMAPTASAKRPIDGAPERRAEGGYPILALWVTALLLLGILVAALGSP